MVLTVVLCRLVCLIVLSSDVTLLLLFMSDTLLGEVGDLMGSEELVCRLGECAGRELLVEKREGWVPFGLKLKLRRMLRMTECCAFIHSVLFP